MLPAGASLLSHPDRGKYSNQHHAVLRRQHQMKDSILRDKTLVGQRILGHGRSPGEIQFRGSGAVVQCDHGALLTILPLNHQQSAFSVQIRNITFVQGLALLAQLAQNAVVALKDRIFLIP